MTLKRSDVLIARPGSMEEYKRYRATALGWGFLPEPDRRGLPPHEEMLRDVDEAHRCGLKFQGRVEFDADWMGMIDFDANFMESVVRDLDGNPAKTWWVHTYKGHPSYFFCTNAPRYRDYLDYQVRRVMAAGADWLMIDCAIPSIEALNNRYGGCFCEHCMAGFRNYLAEIKPAALQKHGIGDLNTFDYRAFLIDQGIDVAQYKNEILAWPPTIPLAEDFFDYQYRSIGELFLHFKKYAAELAGKTVPMSSNSQFYQPVNSYATPAVDFYTREVAYKTPEDEVFPLESVYALKLADALDRLVAVVGEPRAFEPARTRALTGHIRLWIAQAYALGHPFMAPVKMWTRRIKNEPDRWYYSQPGDFEPLYHFALDHADLFDDYESLASVGVIFGNRAARRAQHGMRHNQAPELPVRQTCADLVRLNVPFGLIIAGDDWVPDQLLAADLDQYQALVVNEPPDHLSQDQIEKLDQAAEKLVNWPDQDRLFELLDARIRFEGAADIFALPRVKKGDPTAPAVCHLVNNNYLIEQDKFEVQRDFTLVLAKSLYGRVFSSATLYAPGQEPVPLKCADTGDATEIAIPSLDYWAVLKLQ